MGEVDGAVGAAARVLEDAVADAQAAVVDDRRGRCDQPALQGRDGGEELEGGAGRVLALDGPVGQRVVAVRVLERPEQRGLDAVDECGRVDETVGVAVPQPLQVAQLVGGDGDAGRDVGAGRAGRGRRLVGATEEAVHVDIGGAAAVHVAEVQLARQAAGRETVTVSPLLTDSPPSSTSSRAVRKIMYWLTVT